jgi:hypothetical protein
VATWFAPRCGHGTQYISWFDSDSILDAPFTVSIEHSTIFQIQELAARLPARFTGSRFEG